MDLPLGVSGPQSIPGGYVFAPPCSEEGMMEVIDPLNWPWDEVLVLAVLFCILRLLVRCCSRQLTWKSKRLKI